MTERKDIEEYARRNTSPKMPIEKKYVHAYLESLLFSTDVQKSFGELASKTQFNDEFFLYNSYHEFCKALDINKYGHIISYAMLKKDQTLFDMIGEMFFGNKPIQYFDNELNDITHFHRDYTTDYEYAHAEPNPEHDGQTFERTDMYKHHTDYVMGIIHEGFHAYYCDDNNESLTGMDIPTSSGVGENLEDFRKLITVVKPARIEVVLLFEPICAFGTVDGEFIHCGVKEEFVSPFTDEPSMSKVSEILATNEGGQILLDNFQIDVVVESEKNGETLSEHPYLDSYYLDYDDHVELVYELRVTSLSSETKPFTKVKFKSKDISIKGFEFEPLTVLPQDSSNVHFLTLKLRFEK